MGLALFLILKVLAAGTLPALALFSTRLSGWQPAAWVPVGPLVVATICGRWLILPMGRQPGARPGGLGADFALGLSQPALLAAAVVLAAVTLLGGPRAVLAVLAAHGMAWLILQAARRRLGGVTGDILGLTVELSELTVLLVYAAHPS